MAISNATAKGRRLVQLAKKILEANGCHVEVATNAVRWIPRKAGSGLMPISVHHDFFGCMDLLALWPDGTRAFYQVTTLSEVSHRRAKILDTTNAWRPWDTRDAILAYKGGRGRHFRVIRGPAFETESDERWEP